MHQTKKGNHWHFGMKAHIGVDADPGLVHTMVGTAARLMDEPSEGLAPVIVEQVFEALERIRQRRDMAIVLVEQHAELALSFSERAIVMDRGRIVFEGPSSELRGDAAALGRIMGIAH